MAVPAPRRPYPFSEPYRLDVDPLLSKLQQDEPVSPVRLPFGEPAWLVTRHADVKTVLTDPRFSLAAAAGRDAPRSWSLPVGPQSSVLGMDPPGHTRLRRLVAQAFTPRRVALMRVRVQQIATELIDGMIGQGPGADLVEAFAAPLTSTVICEMLGVPAADRGRFTQWSHALVNTTLLSDDEVLRYLASLADYLSALIAERRAHPADDLLDAMIRARDEHDQLTETELLHLAMGLLVAGHETTASEIPNFVFALLTHPVHLAMLLERPGLVPRAVEELLRFVPLGNGSTFARYALEDVRLSGQAVSAGDPVVVEIAAANRDPRVFAAPERLDLTRDPNPHLAFGHGPHHCLGAQTARLELQIALGTLLRRLPRIRLADDVGAIPWKAGVTVRGPSMLRLEW